MHITTLVSGMIFGPGPTRHPAPGPQLQGLQDSLAGQVSAADGLEVDDDVCDLEVALLLQVGQDSSPEEDLALADAEQVGVQLQGSDL